MEKSEIKLQKQPRKQGVFITGTDTNVGKTWVGVRLAQKLQHDYGLNVIPRKPVESGWSDEKLEQTDAWLLASAADKQEYINQVCPYRFKAPVSPERAAQNEGVTLSLDAIRQCCEITPGKNDFILVEGAGGFYSPLCADALNADLMLALGLPLLLVAEDRLGCINQVLLNIEAIKNTKLKLCAVVLNRKKDQGMDAAHKTTHHKTIHHKTTHHRTMANALDLESRIDVPLVTINSSFSDSSNDKAFAELCRLLRDAMGATI